MRTKKNHPIVGKVIENVRKEQDITIADLAREVHIGNNTYEKVKKGSM